MTIEFIDHALNVVLTGLLYGSEAWVIGAFGLYVATHERPTTSSATITADAKNTLVEENTENTVAESAIAKHTVTADLEVAVKGTTAEADKDVKANAEKVAIQKVITQKAVAQKAATKRDARAKASLEQSTPLLTYPTESIPTEFAPIVCEPVDWKKWKVSELRKASIAKTCGVRTRPIGSRRNLLKADLIAQYKQQLKRFTKIPTTTVSTTAPVKQKAKQKTAKRERIMA
ncbi:hypothetical protein [cf. Phormidesmis sp. LEGE 11477]|uniref:hypothetical protein n=1 Tax=cf. Phormidesmis sp. LEGE 11477 TaxID=1828680 RepID=UPI001880389E|nr:hypothetical protein [cf. Phormidesmis sp. LEGE 11477]MBE9062800.1 hypothetical protein [cf. Phormidesmis sp. LEGE 11477]